MYYKGFSMTRFETLITDRPGSTITLHTSTLSTITKILLILYIINYSNIIYYIIIFFCLFFVLYT
jgi:hypothetical protein